MHDLAFPLLVALIVLALAFDFLNGLHDAANSIATVVSTQLLSPLAAVVFAAVGNFATHGDLDAESARSREASRLQYCSVLEHRRSGLDTREG